MQEKPDLVERAVSSLSYITMGFVGFIWLIVGLFTNAKLKPFVMYHIFQSVFISLGFTVISLFIGFVSNILSFIPLINKIVAQITFLLNMPLFFDYSLIQAFIYVVLIYLAITSFAGQYSYIPWISNIISQNFTQR